MIKNVLGTVRGKVIVLSHDLGLPDGQQLSIAVHPIGSATLEPWGEGLRRCAAALTDMEGLDEDMEQILQARRTNEFRDISG